MGLGWTRLGGVGEWTRVLMRMRMVMRRMVMVMVVVVEEEEDKKMGYD